MFDDLVADPLGVYRRALEFLDVDYDGQTTFETRYESRMYRYRWLQRLLFVPATRGGRMMADAAAAHAQIQSGRLEAPGPRQARDELEQGPRQRRRRLRPR